MLLIHPLMQLMATVLVLVVLQQGIQRFRFQHLNKKVAKAASTGSWCE